MYKKSLFEAQRRQIDDATIINDYHVSNDAHDIVVMDLNGTHGTFKNSLSEKIYLVLEGDIFFIIDGEEIEALAGDIVRIPPDHVHSMTGKNAKAAVICSPPFDPETEETVEV